MPLRVHMIGDSHMEALGPRLLDALPAARYDVTYEFHRGYSTQRAAEAFSGSVADVYVVELGGNDRGDQDMERAALVRQLRQVNPASRIVWFGPPRAVKAPFDLYHDQQAASQGLQFAALTRNASTRFGWFDSRPWTQTGHGPDGVHFTMTAYRTWAQHMAQGIEQQIHRDNAMTWRTSVVLGGAVAFVGLLLWIRTRRH